MGIKVRSLLALALSTLTVLLLVSVLVGEDASAQVTEVVVSIEETDRDQTARPTDTENDLLTFRGDISLDKTFWVPGLSVQLTPRLQVNPLPPSSWEATFNPEFLTFTASGVQNFTATLVVPPGLSAASIYQLTFNVTTSDLIFYNLDEGSAQVTIAQFYKIGRQYSTLPLKVTQGQIIEFNITIINRGNGQDTFLLTVTNMLELEDAGLTPIAPPSSGRVGPGGEDNVKLQLQASDDAIISEFSLNLTITSEESQNDARADTVVSGAEWTVVVEAGIGTTITNNLKYIIPGVLIVVVVVAFIIFRRRRMSAKEEEREEERMEGGKKRPSTGTKGSKGSTGTKGSKGSTGTKGSKGSTGTKGSKGSTGTKGSKGSGGRGSSETKKPGQGPQRRTDDDAEDRYYGE